MCLLPRLDDCCVNDPSTSSVVGLGAGDLNGVSCLTLSGSVTKFGRWSLEDLRR
jgi:hypothetical protein